MVDQILQIKTTDTTNVALDSADASLNAAPNQEYIDNMVNKADQGLQLNTGEGAEVTDLLAGKYKTEEDLNKGILEVLNKTYDGNMVDAYKVLEKGIGNDNKGSSLENTGEGNQANASETGTDLADNKNLNGTTDGLDKDLQNAGEVDTGKYTEEFVKDGKLSSESYEELNALGFSNKIVDQYLSGLVSDGEKHHNTVFDLAGGEANYQKVMQWGEANLSPEKVDIYDKAIESGDIKEISQAFSAVMNDYKEVHSSNPNVRITPNNLKDGGNINMAGYQSRAEMQSDMNDPKYQKDPAFRNQVMLKIKHSKIF